MASIERDISFNEIDNTLEELLDVIVNNEYRLHRAPVQWLHGEMLTRIHVRGENSAGETMNYKSARYKKKRAAKGLRTDKKDLQYEQNSLLMGFQVVDVKGKPTLSLEGKRRDKYGTIEVKTLGGYQEDIEGTEIWEPTEAELKETINRYIIEFEAILKEKL